MIVITEKKMLPYPSVCIACGSNANDCVNFEATQNWNGALLICTNCIKFVVATFPAVFQMAPLSELEAMENALVEANVREDRFESALEEFKENLRAAHNRFDSLLGAPSPVDSAPVDSVEDNEGSAPAAKPSALLDL